MPVSHANFCPSSQLDRSIPNGGVHPLMYIRMFVCSGDLELPVNYSLKLVAQNNSIILVYGSISTNMVNMNYSPLGFRFDVIVIANKLWCKINSAFINTSHTMYVPILLDSPPSTKCNPSKGLWMLRLNICASCPQLLEVLLCVHSLANLRTWRVADWFCLGLNYKYLP